MEGISKTDANWEMRRVMSGCEDLFVKQFSGIISTESNVKAIIESRSRDRFKLVGETEVMRVFWSPVRDVSVP